MRLIVVAVLLVASGCAPGRGDVLVGAIYPTGGGQGPGGIEEWRGVRLAADRINATGGIRGRQIRLDLEPTDAADQAPAAVERLTGRGAQVIVGSYGSTISMPAAAAASRLGAVFWETGAVGDLGMRARMGERVFRFPAAGGVLGHEAVAFVRDRLAPGRPLTFAVAYVDDVYGRAVARGATDEVRTSDHRLGAEIAYDLRSADYADIVRQVAASGADALFVSAYLDDGVEIRREVVRQGIPLVANIGTSSSYCMRAFGAALGGDAVGAFASDKPSGDVMDPARLDAEAAELLRWARTTYERRYDDVMTAPALTGFAGAWALFAHVMRTATALDADGVAASARRADLPRGALPNGSGVQFVDGANARATSVIWEWVAPQTRQIVWPEAFAAPGAA